MSPPEREELRAFRHQVYTLFGRLFGDKGYLSAPLAEQLFLGQGLRLITNLRKTMRNALMPFADKLLLRKRDLIETIFDQLKNVCQIEHSRHRSPINFLVHLFAGLAAYCHQPKKPSLGLDLHRRFPASLIPNWILLANWPQGRKSAYFCYWPGPIFRADTSAYEFANSIELT